MGLPFESGVGAVSPGSETNLFTQTFPWEYGALYIDQHQKFLLLVQLFLFMRSLRDFIFNRHELIKK